MNIDEVTPQKIATSTVVSAIPVASYDATIKAVIDTNQSVFTLKFSKYFLTTGNGTVGSKKTAKL